ncbi:MAG: hypothetical protein ACOH5I_19495 [Oligoflexus sp.]
MISLCFCSSGLLAATPVIGAVHETTPIPAGDSETDDATVWFNKDNPKKSLI